MPESRPVVIPFAWRGQVLKSDKGDLTAEQFQTASNVTSLLDGSVCTRQGRKSLGRMDVAHTTGTATPRTLPHTIAKLRIGDIDANNLRYIGENDSIFRTTDYHNFTLVATGVDDGADIAGIVQRRWTMATYSAGASGDAWAYFATPHKMLREHGSAPFASLENWGIQPASGVAEVSVGAIGASGPDGGAVGSPDASTSYDYIYCYVNG